MTNIFNRELVIDKISIEKIITSYSQGNFAIPEFQRDYVWQTSKAAKLLDSPWNRFPIGAILTWSSEDPVQSRVRQRVSSPTQWIIDGQQRTRTLVKIYNGEIQMLFDLKETKFLLENAATKKAGNPWQIPIVDIWGPRFTTILKHVEDFAANTKQQKEFEERLYSCRKLLDIEVAKIHLSGHGLDEAIQAFQRINTHGMRLKSTDIEVAELTVQHSGFVKNHVQPYLDKLKNRGWERVYLSQLFLACEGIAEAGKRGDHRKRLHHLSKSELIRAWHILEEGVEEAIEFLDDELGIKSSSLFPTGAMLMPIAILFSKATKFRPKAKEIISWMIMASITKRYTGSAIDKMDKDINACFSVNPMNALMRNIKKTSGRSKIAPSHQNFNGALHDRYAMFLTYLACRASGMKDLFDGRQVSTSTSEWHHIIPRASIHKSKRRQLDNSANISFIIGKTNRAISNSKAVDYLSEIDSKLLETQCIPLDTELWDDPNEFMKNRALLLVKSIKTYL